MPNYANILRDVRLIITIAGVVYEFVQPIYGKIKEAMVEDLNIDCPSCGENQIFDLDNIKKGWFKTYIICEDCGKKIKMDVELEEE